MKKFFTKSTVKIRIVMVFLGLSFAAQSQNVNIPDANFKNALLSNGSVNTNSDGEIQVSEANVYGGFLNVNGLGITDLTGIEAFTNIDNLNCSDNQLTSLDLSANTNLQYVYCNNNLLTSINVSAITGLLNLVAGDNQLASIDVSNNFTLEVLFLENNLLTNIDLSNNGILSSLNLTNNQLSNIDLFNNSQLQSVLLNDNQLTGLSVFNLLNLTEIRCANNPIVSLDLSNNTLLSTIVVFNCSALTSLNLKNIDVFSIGFLNATGNTNLSCVSVDDVANFNANWSFAIDGITIYNLNCDAFVNIPDGVFKNVLTSNSVINPNLDGEITYAEAAAYTGSIAVNYLGVSDLTGIEAFVNITDLNCSNNTLSTLDLTSNSKLQSVDCSFNNLSTFATPLTNTLTDLNCSNNQISSIFLDDVSGLVNFDCSYNTNLTSISVIQNTSLQTLDVSHCDLSTLDLSFNPFLISLKCGTNNLTALSLNDCPLIEYLDFSDNAINSIDVSFIQNVNYLDASSNPISSIDISANNLITSFFINYTSIAGIPVFNNPGILSALGCAGLGLSSIDLSIYPQLTKLICASNNLISIDFSANPNLGYFICNNNALTSLDFSSNLSIYNLDCSDNALTFLSVKNGTFPTFDGFDATNNPALICIEVDDVSYFNATWNAAKDAGASYSLSCGSCTVNIPDVNFKNALIANLAINTNADTEIQCSEASAYAGAIDVNSLGIADLTGIEAFVNITDLNCSYNSLTNIDISANTLLQGLNLYSNQLSALDVSANVQLQNLYCGGNLLNAIDVTNNTALTTFSCGENLISSLNVTSLLNLTYLSCNNNSLTSIDVSQNTLLDQLDVSTNAISSIDLSHNTLLTILLCQATSITSIDLSNNLALSQLYLNGNAGLNTIDLSNNLNLTFVNFSNTPFTSLDFTNNIALYSIGLFNTDITSLDVSNQTSLTQLSCSNTPLSSLNMQNGNNSNLTLFFANNNPSLTCIQVDDPAFMNTNWSAAKDAIASYNTTCGACLVNIPDANFKAALVANDLIDTNFDDEIQCTEATAFNGTIDVNGLGINDLTGIEAFVNITELNCTDNLLINIDITANTALNNLFCGSNQLSSLDVSNNSALTNLGCGNNLLTSIDVTSNTALVYLDCELNQITSLNVAANTAITFLSCGANQLTSIDVTSNTLLSTLTCGNNSFTSLDVTANTSLSWLDCRNNQLTSLDVSNNTALNILICINNNLTGLDLSTNGSLTLLSSSGNQLTSLDVSANSTLNTIDCSNNNLASLNVANGNNNILTSFSATNNPSLSCIQVSDLTFMNANFAGLGSKDAGATYSTVCPLPCTVNIPDAAFKAALVANDFIDTNFDDEISCAEAAAYSGGINVSGLGISDLTGIEAFTALTNLHCGNNNLTSIDLSSNTQLTYLVCGINQLSTLDVSACTSLGFLDCENNQLTLLNISTNTALTELRCGQNQLTSIDVSNKLALNVLFFGSNLLSSIDLSSNTALISLRCSDNLLSSLDLSSNTLLENLFCAGNQFTSLDLTSNTALILLDGAANAQLTSINTTGCTALETIFCYNSPLLTTVDLSTNTALKLFGASNTALTSLDFSGNPVFEEFTCVNCQLTSLNIQNGNNNNLTSISVLNNPSLTCIQVDDATYMNTTWGAAKDAGATYSTVCPLCIVNIPDVNFKAALIADLSINTNSNTEIECSEATAFTGSINVASLGITDLTGIEAFTAITGIDCSLNNLTSIDLNSNTALLTINCNSNSLSTLDISNNLLLNTLFCGSNLLTSIDVSLNTALTDFRCFSNQISSLNLTANTDLTYLACGNNQIASLNLNANTLLGQFSCNNNLLTSLDISSNPLLTTFDCSSNFLTAVDVSACLNLNTFFCHSNQITNLDVSNNVILQFFQCQNNNLNALNVQNGFNSSLGNFNATNNPSLTCIQVDDASYMNTNWITGKDAGATFSVVCPLCVVSIPDANFKAALVANLSINTNADAEIQCSEANAYMGIIDVNSLGIADLTGIESFVNITQLNCSNNLLSTLDLSNNIQLTELRCHNNSITNIDATPLVNLTKLYCWSNNLISINTTGLSNLLELRCDVNNLTSIDVSTNTSLTGLVCFTNAISSIDVSNNPLLTQLVFDNNPISNIDISNNLNITEFACGGTSLSAINLSQQTALTSLYCANIPTLSSLNIQNGNNINLTFINATNNASLTCIQVDDATYMNTNWSAAKDAGANYNVNCNPSVTISPITDTICSGTLVSFVSTLANGGASPTYQWKLNGAPISGANNPTYNTFALATGDTITCEVTVNAVSYISNSATFTVNIRPTVTHAATNIACNGDASGSIDVTPNGGVSPYNYLWYVGSTATTEDISGLSPGVYSILITDVNGCTAADSNIVIVEPTAISGLFTFNNASCNGVADGSIDISISGGTFPYLYNWNDGDHNEDRTGLAAGSYDVVTVDANGCSFTISGIAISEPAPVTPPSLSVIDNCGSSEITASGVSGVLNWSDLGSGNPRTVGFGTYSATQTVGGCTSLSSNVVNANPLASPSTSPIFGNAAPACNATGEIYSVTNSTGSSYTWSVPAGATITSGATGPNNSSIFVNFGNTDGNITVIETGINGCTGTQQDIAIALVGCGVCNVNIPDANFKAALLADLTINTNADAEIQCAEASAFTGTINVSGLSISDLTGIEAFTALKGLDCALNNLSGVNLSSNTALTTLNVSGNNLGSLDVTNNTLLLTLQCHNILISTLDVSNNTALTILDCSLNSLSTIDVSNNTSLITLICGQNPLTSLNVNNNIALENLYCEIAQLTSLDVSLNTALINLNCSENSILNLNLSNNSALQTLDCAVNQLSSLDVSGNVNLTSLSASFNNITSIDVSGNTLLESLSVINNTIANLDISNNTLITTFSCSNNALTSLNIKNTNNTNFVFFEALNNPSLTCIQVDDATYMNTNWIAAKDAGATYSVVCPLCLVNIPDANFKAALVADLAINTNADAEIQCSEAIAYTGTIDVNSLGIADLTGIEAFVNITELSCFNNLLTSLDLTQNTALLNLNCNSNLLTSLDVSANIALTGLSFIGNNISTIDLLNNSSLLSLSCGQNQLTSLDLSNNAMLTGLACGVNQLNTLNLSNNPALTFLTCNQNNIVSIDLSAQPNMSFIICNSNQLTSLNIQNGNNINITNFDATGNPALSCIQVDDATYMNTNWIAAKDAGATYSVVCPLCLVNIPDANFKAALVADLAINTNADAEIQCSEASAYTGTIDVNSLGIADLTGIEAFVNITQLNCSNNLLGALDVSNNTQLTELRCHDNLITNLDATALGNLTKLYCWTNNLTSVNTTGLTNLLELRCDVNNLTSIDVSTNTSLLGLVCFNNALSTIDVSNNPLLTQLVFDNNPISNMDISNNLNITEFASGGTNLSSLNLSQLAGLTSLYCANMPLLSNLNIQNGNNTNLTLLNATNNPSLSCIQVDDATFMNTTWSAGKDAGAAFSISCGLLADFVADFTNVCQGSVINFTDFSTGTTGSTTYLWDFGDGNISNVTGSTSHTYLTAGTFTVTLTVTDGISNAKVLTNYITINPTPAAPILTVVDNCGSSEITASGVVGTLIWSDSGSGNPRTETTGSFTVTQDLGGCLSANSNTVTVNPLAIPGPVLILGNMIPNCAAIGQNYSVALNAGSNYAWSVPAGANITSGASGPDNNNITVDFGTNNGFVSVIETNAVGCAGLSIDTLISLQGCALAANFTADITNICEGATVTFTDLSTGTTGSTLYAWNFGNGQVASSAGPHNISYTSNGSFTVSLTITEGASSTQTFTNYITVNSPSNGTDVQTACDTYTWIDGLTYNASTNTPTFLLTNAAGCDSLVTLNLTINNSTNGTDIQTACDTYTWIDGLTYNVSTNTPTFLLTNAAGCDSLVTLNLTINNSTNGTDVQTACDTYTWIDGLTYNASTNTPTFLLTNAAGCDSLVTLNLTINNSTNGTDVQTACDTYTWIDGSTYNASTNTPTFLLTNAAGCDSLVTLNLTINNSTNGTDVQTACDTYTWIDGLTYNASTNTPTFLLTNAAGCDSLVTLNLTINNSTNGTDVQTACDTYTWIDGLTYNASTNTPTFLLTNASGCDSLVTLNLTINNSTNGTDVQTACDTYTWIDGLTYNASTNTPTFLLTNAAGCDSLVTLNLTINNSTNGTDVQTACDTYTWIDGLTYNASTNAPTFLLTNAAGCDSLVTLNLTINNSTNGTDVQTACDTYTWIDGLTYNASTNAPTFLLTNAAGCDSLVTLNLTINNSTNGTDVQTACDTYTWIDGLTYNASTNAPTFLLTNAAGCDSLVTLNLTINNSTNGTDVQTACDTYTWIDGLTYNASTNTPTFLLTNAAGCDSLVTLNLTINNSTNGTDVQTACDTYTWIDGLTYNASTNTPTFLLTNASGCDSLVTLNLTINNSTNGTDVQTACDTYTWIDGLTYNASTNTPTFLLTNAAGCDSLVTLNLTINNSTNGTDVQTACDTYTWIDGLTYNASTNTPTFLLTNAAGCDSLVTLNLTINNSTNGTDVQTACDTYTWIDGLTYNASTNTPTFLLTNAAGCDSLVTLNLTINNSTNGTDVQTACDTYTWIDGLTYNASTNTPTFLLTNAAGCDSLVTLNLTINNSTNGTDVQTACDTYTWIDGLTYNASTNTPTFLLTNAAGCDSLVTLNLTINNSTNGTDVQTACDTYTWIDGLTYNASTNTPTFLLTNAAGCDSLVTLNLTINNSTNGTDVQTACDTYTWIDGLTYNASTNTPTFLLTNAAGCDSLVTLNLTINNSTNGTDVQTACDTYTWIDGLTYNTSTNTPTFLLTNAAGCDSLVTLNLTINNSTNGTDVQTACDTYTWIDGLTYNASTNTPTFLLTNAAGCDSLVTLNLTINNSTNGTDVQTACDTYTWIDGLTYNASTNTPTFLLTNAAGCDSLVTLNLTINNSTNGTDVQTACDTYTWIDGLTYNASTNTPTFLLTNAAGCDSLVTLNLTINNSTNGTDVQTACDTYTWIDGLTYNASTNTPTFLLTNAAGCDSLVTLNLTINNSTNGTDVQTACDTYTWIDGLTYNASTNAPTFLLTNAAGCDSLVTLNLTINNSTNGTDVQTACDTYTWIDGLTYNASTNAPTFLLTNAAGCDSLVTLNLTINNSTNGTDVQTACDTYTWIDGLTYIASTNTPTFLLTNAAGCDSLVTLNLTINITPSAPIVSVVDNCGSSDVTANGVVGNLSWSDLGTGNPRNFLTPVTITATQDLAGCISLTSNSVTTNPLGVTSITNTLTNETCGSTNGSYDVTAVTGGNAPFTYSIDGITYVSTTLFSGLPAGAYTIYVKDNNNCIYSEPFNIINIPGVTSITNATTNETCGGANGSYDVTGVTGGTAPYTYSTDGITYGVTTLFGNLTAGAYTIFVKDNNNCVYSEPFIITNFGGGTAVTNNTINETCGAANGSYDVTGVTGGTAPYTYSTDGITYGAATLFSGLTAGAYTIYVKDNNNCIYSEPFNIINTPGVTSITNATTNETCGAANGSYDVTGVTGGTAPYTYSTDGITYGVTTLFGNLTAGAYTIFVKDNNNCFYSEPFNITNTGGVTALTNVTTNETCGATNGSYDVTGVTGGTAPFTYSTDGIIYGGATLFSSLTAGAYTIYVKDNNNCIYSEPFNITNLGGVTAITNNTIDATCGASNGSFNITGVTGGIAPYTYSSDGITYVATTLFSGLTAGAYTIYVKDNNNCVYSEPFTINTTTIPVTSAITGNINPICNETGVSYSVILTAGSTYAWTVPAGATIISGNAGPDNNIIAVDLGSTNGNIDVIETNASGCVGASQSLAITLQGCGLAANYSVDTDTICEGASVTFTDLSTGTTGSSTYFWDFGAGAVPATATGAGPHVITYIATGSATVSLTVTEGAVSTITNPNNITVNPILTPSVSIAVANSTICGPTVLDFTSAIVNGGANPNYQWQLNGVDIVGANGDTLNINTLVESDTISLNIISSEACMIAPNAVSNQIGIIDSCDAIITTIPLSLNTYCAGSNLVVNYTVAGNVNSNNVFIAQLSNATGSFTSPTDIGQLTATGSGSIPVTIPDITAAGTQYRIRVVSNSPAISGTDNGTDIVINSTNFGVNFSVANLNLTSLPMLAQFNNITPNLNQYTFTWYFGDGAQFVNDSVNVSYTYNYNGSYNVSLVATDLTTGCSQTIYDTLNTILCSGFTTNACNHTASINAPNVINGCAGSQLNLNVNNFNPAFTYQWHRNGTAINGGNYQTLSINTSGFYSVTVFDTAGCPKTSNPVQVSFNLPAVSPPVITISGQVGNCGLVNATLNASGNFAAYLWNTGASADSINITQAGLYSVIGQGSLGCDAQSQPFAVSSSFLPTPTICMVTVDTLTNHHLLMWEKPVTTQIQSFAIYKEIPFNSNNYQQIAVLPYDSLSEFIDTSSNAALVTDRYRLSFIDTCNGETAYSDFVRAIGLKVFPGVGVQRVLSWNSYTGAAQNITSYLVYSGPDYTSMNIIANVAPGAPPFIDNNPVAGLNTVYRVHTELSQACESTRALRNRSQSNGTGNYIVTYPDTTTAISKLTTSNYKFNILPNPNNGNFIINWKNDQIAPGATVWIESMYGQKVTAPVTMTENNMAISIDVKSGVYFVRVNSSAGEWTIRLVVVN